MTGAYTEATVKRKKTVGTFAAKAAMIFGVLLFLALWLFPVLGSTVGSISIVLAIGMTVLCIAMFPRFDVVFEYVYCDGQIDFDKISGGEKRKRMLRIDLDNIEIMAPENSSEIKAFDNQNLNVKDYSSLDPDAKKYVIVASEGNERSKIVFEPSDTMLELAKGKATRKVFLEGESGKMFIQ